MTRSYTELRRIENFEDRYHYLALKESVGKSTFGFDRYINQKFYTSKQWRDLRHNIIARDNGCDLGVDGYEIHNRLIIHHMNPMSFDDISRGDSNILDPRFLITTTLRTHNAIHFGDERLLPKVFVERSANDTNLW